MVVFIVAVMEYVRAAQLALTAVLEIGIQAGLFFLKDLQKMKENTNVLVQHMKTTEEVAAVLEKATAPQEVVAIRK